MPHLCFDIDNENDFEEIFKSGQSIDIYFSVKIGLEGLIIHEEEFRHSIIFDPLTQLFSIELEDQGLSFSTNSYDELKIIISNYFCYGILSFFRIK